MPAVSRFSILKALSVAALGALAVAAVPAAAEAQARGTLQASATVVDTRQGFAALEATRAAVWQATRDDVPVDSRRAVATVAEVTVERPSARRGSLVVTIAYSRN